MAVLLNDGDQELDYAQKFLCTLRYGTLF